MQQVCQGIYEELSPSSPAHARYIFYSFSIRLMRRFSHRHSVVAIETRMNGSKRRGRGRFLLLLSFYDFYQSEVYTK